MLSYSVSEKPLPDSKVHGANMGSIWGRQDPGGPHVGPVTLLSGLCCSIHRRLKEVLLVFLARIAPIRWQKLVPSYNGYLWDVA